ncbi:hypothetical protein ACQEU5_12565 [Marinactinospora thermotolerans]|uniref:PH domain-containing protein n=1 Tax=Marinactinospora thermotolerans DSM 45154 TaxID=1122192 RepID=A0A1T4SBG8_9ACTN|nr:hypothetical protein [Marinactinospora thermotolerans]SKA25563.1 hypothetical protein SAMN02745673_03321 [Marinactinospora thermotolerans DSM 45154]
MRQIRDELVLRPDRRSGRTKLAVSAVIAVVMTVSIAFRVGWEVALASVVFWIVLFAVVIGHLRHARIVLTPYEIAVEGMVFRQRRPRSQAVRVVRATVVPSRGWASDTLFLLDAHDNVLFRVYGLNYATEDINRLVGALGLPCEGPGRPVSAGELAKIYPGIVPWYERHPYLLGLLTTGVVALVVLAVVLIAISMGAGS